MGSLEKNEEDMVKCLKLSKLPFDGFIEKSSILKAWKSAKKNPQLKGICQSEKKESVKINIYLRCCFFAVVSF
jgi:hypothetical protein